SDPTSPRTRGEVMGTALRAFAHPTVLTPCTSQVEPAARGAAFVVAGKAGDAHLGANRVDGAGGGDAHLPHPRGAAAAITTRTAAFVVHETLGDAGERRIVLEREPRPLARIGAARPAGLAIEGRLLTRRAGAGQAHLRTLPALRGALPPPVSSPPSG